MTNSAASPEATSEASAGAAAVATSEATSEATSAAPLQAASADVVLAARPVFRPEVATYLANRQMAAQMFVHSLQDREDDAGLADSDGVNAGSGDADKRGTYPRATWLRTWGQRVHANSDRPHQSGLVASTDVLGLQGGVELAQWPLGSAGRLHVGAMGGYGHASSRGSAVGNAAGATGQVQGWQVGGYATWFADDTRRHGAYVDSWVQYGWFSNRVQGDQLPTVRYRNQGWAVSGEAGYGIPLGRGWVVEPQVQWLYLDARNDDITEANGTRVTASGVDGSITRVGLRGRRQFATAGGGNAQVSLAFNWWHTRTGNSMTFSDVPVGDLYPASRYEVTLGIQGALSRRWSAWANVSGSRAAGDFEQYALRLGARYVW